MIPEFDVQALRGLFLDEAHEQLSVLEDCLLALGTANSSEESISEAFRAAHTLKGAARTMGLEAIGNAAHSLEDSLEALRRGHDLSEDMMEGMRRLLDEIRAGLSGTGPRASTTLTFTVELAPDCAMKSVRAELLLRALQAQGTVLSTRPQRSTLDHQRFDVVMETSAPFAEIRATALGQTDVRSCELAGAGKKTEPTRKESTVRVPTARLDHIVDIAGELVTQRARLGRWTWLLSVARPDDPDLAELTDISDRISQLVGELQHVSLGVRLLPIEGTFRRLVRMVQDISKEIGKEIDVALEGIDTEVDRSVADVLIDPLIHLMRNSIDHGIESSADRLAAGKNARGQVTLRAWQADGEVYIEVEDDGRGIDLARVREVALAKGLIEADDALQATDCVELIFRSGLSTTQQVTELSGRGVGMDIVRANLERVGGRIEVETVLGKGTVFRITLPVSLSILRCLLVQAGPSIVAIPEVRVKSTTMMPCDLRSLSLSDALGDERLEADPRSPFAIVVHVKGSDWALGIDRLVAEQDLVVKPLAAWLAPADGILGASVLANGRVVLIVDPVRMIESLTQQPSTV